jgi:hypothetical protein
MLIDRQLSNGEIRFKRNIECKPRITERDLDKLLTLKFHMRHRIP